jgi:hypothetical protein
MATESTAAQSSQGCPGVLGSRVCISCASLEPKDGGLRCARYRHFLVLDEFWRRIESEAKLLTAGRP